MKVDQNWLEETPTTLSPPLGRDFHPVAAGHFLLWGQAGLIDLPVLELEMPKHPGFKLVSRFFSSSKQVSWEKEI